jgi:hypothetical protein
VNTPFSHKPGTRARYRVASVEEAITAYRRHLAAQLRAGEMS